MSLKLDIVLCSKFSSITATILISAFLSSFRVQIVGTSALNKRASYVSLALFNGHSLYFLWVFSRKTTCCVFAPKCSRDLSA